MKKKIGEFISNMPVTLIKGFVISFIFIFFLIFILDKIFVPGFYMELIYPKIMSISIFWRFVVIYFIGLIYERIWPNAWMN